MTTWVFLRGLTRSSAHWASFVDEFQAANPAEVIALDLPGNGSLYQQESPSNVAALALSCRTQLQARGCQGPVGVLAVSMGAMVAVQWAMQWPSELRELVLINASMRPFSLPWERLRPSAAAKLIGLAGRGGVVVREQGLLHLTTNHPRHQVLQTWCDERRMHPVSGRNALRQLAAAARFKASSTAPTVPTLVLASEGDRLVSVQCSVALAEAWGCTLQLHPTAGHDLTLDAGPWVAEEVRRWSQRTQTPMD